ncbi:MAG: presqualene diphosphate synthase HpnD [Betaproteobacteria bacterium]|jgi:phytoene synthase|nr:presqualene diphosphate synthase HpnD [Betaproteobacteria bacterium]
MSPDEYCQQKAAASGSSFYYSFLFLPPEKRRAITAVYAFCREVDDAVDDVHEPSVAQAKLAWWRREIDAAFDGTPEHPVGRALAGVAREHDLPREHFHAVVDGMQMDLEQTRYLDFASLERYCHRVAGVVGLLAARIFGYSDKATEGYARDLGIAFQLTNIVRDVGEDAMRGRIYVPQEDLARFGVPASQILKRDAGGNFAALMAFQVQRARDWYERALSQLPRGERRAQRVGLAMAAIYRALLAEIERDGYRVLDRRIALTPVRKLWIAWKTALLA